MNFSGNNDWPVKLQTLLTRYNKTIHTAHKFTPDEVEQFSSQNNVRKLNEVIANLDKTFLKQNKDFDLSQLPPGTKVRVQLNPKQNSLTKSKFMQNYSKDVYTIDKIYVPRQSNLLAVQYRLKDQQNRIIPKRYYNHQLLKIEGTPQNRVSREALYNISNLLKPVVQDNKPYYLVSWIGFQGQYTLEPRSQLMQDVPRLVQMFERRNMVVWVTTSGRRIQKMQEIFEIVWLVYSYVTEPGARFLARQLLGNCNIIVAKMKKYVDNEIALLESEEGGALS